jgi:adenylate cyclase
MAPEPIDFAAEGLLDGLEGDARAERLVLLEQLTGEGVPLLELRRSSANGTLVYLAADRVIGGPDRYTAEQVAQMSGIDARFLLAARRAMGLPTPDPDDAVYTEAEMQSARMTNIALDAGLSEEDLLELLRVLGRNLGQAAESLRALPLKLVLEPGMSESELASRFASASGTRCWTRW